MSVLLIHQELKHRAVHQGVVMKSCPGDVIFCAELTALEVMHTLRIGFGLELAIKEGGGQRLKTAAVPGLTPAILAQALDIIVK